MKIYNNKKILRNKTNIKLIKSRLFNIGGMIFSI